LTVCRGLFPITSRFGFTPWSAGLLAARSVRTGSLLTTAGAARTLGPRAARTDAGSNASFTANATKQSRPGLFDDFDFGVVAMHAEVGEGSIGRLFD
jgi:hypothetical protein